MNSNSIDKKIKKNRKLNTSQYIAIGYFLVILTGSLILSTPFASKTGEWTNFIDALFTATTSTCVTGLVVYDTFTHWSLFGQIIILMLIQIGGVGFMTIISLMGMFLKKKMNVYEQKIIMQASGTIKISETLSIIKKVVIVTLLFELIGAICLSIRFIPDLGFWEGIYYSIFHAVSAFCNAGIDLMGRFGECSSLMHYQNDYLVCITIMLLIITGGLGFLVWGDVANSKFRFKKMQLHTKIVLVATGLLIIIPTFCFYFLEKDGVLQDMSFSQKVLHALFQSVTTRTAGFNTVNLEELSGGSVLLTIILMIIGGSPGSTAGGIKTTTFVVLLLSIAYSFKNTTDITIGKKQLDKSILKQACSILVIYLFAVLVGTILILFIQPELSLDSVLFETSSAIATVGLTMNVTSKLLPLSRIIIILMMYVGRIGGLSVISLFEVRAQEEVLQRPVEKILIG